MALSKERKAKLQKAGFKVGTVQEFLGLSDAEIATAIAYLASEDARYVNGASLAIDGGQVA